MMKDDGEFTRAPMVSFGSRKLDSFAAAIAVFRRRTLQGAAWRWGFEAILRSAVSDLGV